MIVLLCQLVSLTVSAGDPASVPRGSQHLFRRAAAAVATSVVRIETVGGVAGGGLGRPIAESGQANRPRGPFRDTPGSDFRPADGPTTGLVWSADGYILTSSFNFVRDPVLVTVIVPEPAGPQRFVAKLVARDRVRKLALLKIDASDLPVPAWADPADVRVGQWAIALGRALGGDQPALSVGIVSALDRMMGTATQTDAMLSPANYGGPLVDIDGRVLGICVPMAQHPGELAGAEMYDVGVGFAVTTDHLGAIVAALVQGRSFHRGWLGVQIDATVPDRVRVAAAADPSPLRSAGIQSGDVILSVNGREVRHFGQLVQSLYMLPAGEVVELRIRRGDDEFTREVTLARADELGPLPDTPPPFDPSAPLPGPNENHSHP